MHLMVSDMIPSCNEHKSWSEPSSLSREGTSNLPLCPVPVCLVNALSIPHRPGVTNAIDPSISVSPIWGYEWSAIIQREAEWVKSAVWVIKGDMTIVVDLQDCDAKKNFCNGPHSYFSKLLLGTVSTFDIFKGVWDSMLIS